MPAFSFEKISPPARRAPAATPPKKPRGLLSQMMDRVAERRAKRASRASARGDDKAVK